MIPAMLYIFYIMYSSMYRKLYINHNKLECPKIKKA